MTWIRYRPNSGLAITGAVFKIISDRRRFEMRLFNVGRVTYGMVETTSLMICVTVRVVRIKRSDRKNTQGKNNCSEWENNNIFSENLKAEMNLNAQTSVNFSEYPNEPSFPSLKTSTDDSEDKKRL